MTEGELRKMAESACKMLNGAFARDPQAFYFLQGCRVPCSAKLAESDVPIVVETIPVSRLDGSPQEPNYAVGMIGILTGLFQEMGFPCTIGTSWETDTPNGRPQFLGFQIVDLVREES